MYHQFIIHGRGGGAVRRDARMSSIFSARYTRYPQPLMAVCHHAGSQKSPTRRTRVTLDIIQMWDFRSFFSSVSVKLTVSLPLRPATVPTPTAVLMVNADLRCAADLESLMTPVTVTISIRKATSCRWASARAERLKPPEACITFFILVLRQHVFPVT